MLVELHEHVNRAEDKEKVQLSASLQNYKRALDKLDAVSKKYRDPKFKFNFVEHAKWAWSGEKKLKALHANLKQNSGKFQPLLLQIAYIGKINKHQQEADARKAAEKLGNLIMSSAKLLPKILVEMIKHQQEADAKEAAEKLAKCIRKVMHWLEPLNSQAKLQESSSAGNSKTILVSSVIDYLEENLKHAGKNIVLFAFADFQDPRSTNVIVLLCTLLVQLLDECKLEDFVKELDFAKLEKTIEQHHSDQPKFLQHLVELLRKVSAPWKRMFIVIDALDECMQANRRESITAICNLVSASSKISILVTSRAEQDIFDVLRSVPTISLIDKTKRVKADITKFIKAKMNESYLPLTCFREPVHVHISSTLLEKANGMFCLVDCQLQSLEKAKFESDINEILKNLPSDLNSMYERILQSVEGEGQHAVKIVQHTLWWLVGSLQKLRLEEVMEVVMVETGRDSSNLDLRPLSNKHLLGMCSSLVHHDAKTDNLTLSHASVKDFLFSDYLKGTAYSDYHIPSFPFLHRHTTNLISHLEQHPFLVYVVSNWHLHAAKMYETCSKSGEQPTDIHTLFALSDDLEKSTLAQHSCRQVSYFGAELRYVIIDGSSKLQWGMDKWCEIDHEDLLNATVLEYRLLRDIGGFIVPKYSFGPFWLPIGHVHPRTTTSTEELAFMVCSLISKGPASLVWDLLHKLPQFKDCSLFNCGTPLMISISAGKLDTMKMLLQDFHVDPNTCALHYDCNYEVMSPIFLATYHGDVEAVKLLLQYGSATVFPLEHLHMASYTQSEPKVTLCGVVIKAVNDGCADILQILIHHGANVNTTSSISGNTALHVAVRYGHIDSVKVLVEGGCNLSLHTNGKTPLDLALNQQSLDIIQYLLNKVGEPWYLETRQYLVTPRGGSLNSQQDIEKIASLLEKQLSLPLPHIIRAILDFAELWIVTSAE
ncbi:hypothetical protein IW262DRAFT_1452849 [Armillaria fumosa]|nr:hypothetical protein IW262DRAFT_1452849 [Armillaria fumosa]